MKTMTELSNYIALFDLDGVVLNTEPQYTIFWDEEGKRRLGIDNFCSRIKGQTLTQIFDGYFPTDEKIRIDITNELDSYEQNMKFDYIDGADHFIKDIKKHGMRTGLVTSSNNSKMENVYKAHSEFKKLFDVIITADMFAHSKPNPECFLKGMKLLQSDAAHSVVFEDSFHGLEAGKRSGAFVIGLATTNPRHTIEGNADYIIDDFSDKNAAWLKNTILNK